MSTCGSAIGPRWSPKDWISNGHPFYRRSVRHHRCDLADRAVAGIGASAFCLTDIDCSAGGCRRRFAITNRDHQQHWQRRSEVVNFDADSAVGKRFADQRGPRWQSHGELRVNLGSGDLFDIVHRKHQPVCRHGERPGDDQLTCFVTHITTTHLTATIIIE